MSLVFPQLRNVLGSHVRVSLDTGVNVWNMQLDEGTGHRFSHPETHLRNSTCSRRLLRQSLTLEERRAVYDSFRWIEFITASLSPSITHDHWWRTLAKNTSTLSKRWLLPLSCEEGVGQHWVVGRAEWHTPTLSACSPEAHLPEGRCRCHWIWLVLWSRGGFIPQFPWREHILEAPVVVWWCQDNHDYFSRWISSHRLSCRDRILRLDNQETDPSDK